MRKIILAVAAAVAIATSMISGAQAKADTSPGTIPLFEASQHWAMTIPHPPSGGDYAFLYYNYGNINQQWVLVGPHSNGSYNIRSEDNTGLCLFDVVAGYNLQPCNNSDIYQQFWWGGSVSTGYQIENVGTLQCIADDGGVLANNNRIIPWTCEYPVPAWENWV